MSSLAKMFRSVKNNKPLAQALRDKNSKNKFLTEFSNNENQILNRSLDSVQTAVVDKKPTFKQTKLYIRRSLKRSNDQFNDTFGTAEQFETKTELFIMPSPKMKVLESKVKLNNTICATTDNLERPSCSTKVKREFGNGEDSGKETVVQNVMDKPGRKMLALVGKVDFVLKITKIYPNINALWDVYGKLIKISNGKNRYEHILLMRNNEGDGPILQCIYYDFDNTLIDYSIDSNIRVVGRMTGCNRLRIFKLQAVDIFPQHSNFMRIQNVTTFVLLQNQNANA